MEWEGRCFHRVIDYSIKIKYFIVLLFNNNGNETGDLTGSPFEYHECILFVSTNKM